MKKALFYMFIAIVLALASPQRMSAALLPCNNLEETSPSCRGQLFVSSCSDPEYDSQAQPVTPTASEPNAVCLPNDAVSDASVTGSHACTCVRFNSQDEISQVRQYFSSLPTEPDVPIGESIDIETPPQITGGPVTRIDSPNQSNNLLSTFNPLRIAGSSKTERFSTPGGIVSEILTGYAFPFAGMVLFVMVLWGGFEIMTSSIAGKKDAGRQRITTAIIGFILLFSSYWIAQLVQQIFGVQFL